MTSQVTWRICLPKVSDFLPEPREMQITKWTGNVELILTSNCR